MRISVIICTRNRAKFLNKALEGIYRQDLSKKDYEVIVVDNNSDDDTKNIANKWKGKLPNYKYIVEKKNGLPYARNTGWKAAESPIVIYLDDDAIPDKNWLINILKTYKKMSDSKKFIAIGGGVRLYMVDDIVFPKWLPENMKDYLTRLDYGSESRVLKGDERLVGANFSVPRFVLEKIGGFNEGLYNYGGDERWVEDKIKMMSGILIYSGNSFVNHAVTSERLNEKWFYERFLLEGKAVQRGRTLLRNDNFIRVVLRFCKNIVLYIYYLPNKVKNKKRINKNIFIKITKFYFCKGSIISLFDTLKSFIKILPRKI